jgi:hypothetical protein
MSLWSTKRPTAAHVHQRDMVATCRADTAQSPRRGCSEAKERRSRLTAAWRRGWNRLRRRSASPPLLMDCLVAGAAAINHDPAGRGVLRGAAGRRPNQQRLAVVMATPPRRRRPRAMCQTPHPPRRRGSTHNPCKGSSRPRDAHKPRREATRQIQRAAGGYYGTRIEPQRLGHPVRRDVLRQFRRRDDPIWMSALPPSQRLTGVQGQVLNR